MVLLVVGTVQTQAKDHPPRRVLACVPPLGLPVHGGSLLVPKGTCMVQGTRATFLCTPCS